MGNGQFSRSIFFSVAVMSAGFGVSLPNLSFADEEVEPRAVPAKPVKPAISKEVQDALDALKEESRKAEDPAPKVEVAMCGTL